MLKLIYQYRKVVTKTKMDKQKALNHINKYTDTYLDFLTNNNIYINQNNFNLRVAILNDISEDLQKIKKQNKR